MARIGLVGCGKIKRSEHAPARDLYTGPLFQKARAYAEATCDRWYVLSAFHDLVEPDTVLMPYDRPMGRSKAERELWGAQVQGKLLIATSPGDTLVFLAGADYAEAVRWWNRPHQAWTARVIEQPLAGMGIGQRLHWLTDQLAKIEAGKWQRVELLPVETVEHFLDTAPRTVYDASQPVEFRR